MRKKAIKSKRMWAPVIWNGQRREPDFSTLSSRRREAEQVSNYPPVPVVVQWDGKIQGSKVFTKVIWVHQVELAFAGGEKFPGIETACRGPVDLGHGVKGLLVRSPRTGQEYVVEASAGGVVGVSVAEVKAGIAGCDRAQIKAQLAKGKEQASRVCIVTDDEFWAAVEQVIG